ncbi:methyltransferase family protein [Roseibium hamelinense]|uniref:Methyltransferase family protein n=1 Tax=Roseibium hamelinense TaxID=150831 RepID=A0A562TAA3_9HYPH|nr:class I SAM-dependent methyltransferase [Roseibium hamelinense]TWI90038.1 methyltransferase family protein [Roseibium hamelinense]
MPIEVAAKKAYVACLRGLRAASDGLGTTRLLQRNSKTSRRAHWLLSLLAIHDLKALIALDVPWWAYDAIDEVNRFLDLRPKAQVFEYGSGASTIWLAHRCEHVWSVEHDPDWARQMTAEIARLELTNRIAIEICSPDKKTGCADVFRSQKAGYSGLCFESYAKAIQQHQTKFDLVVVDGRARAGCLLEAIKCLKDDGLIVFDNSGRRRYRETIKSLEENMDVRTYHGMTPSLPYPEETTLISASKNTSLAP